MVHGKCDASTLTTGGVPRRRKRPGVCRYGGDLMGGGRPVCSTGLAIWTEVGCEEGQWGGRVATGTGQPFSCKTRETRSTPMDFKRWPAVYETRIIVAENGKSEMCGCPRALSGGRNVTIIMLI